jgi:hypothetical protein
MFYNPIYKTLNRIALFIVVLILFDLTKLRIKSLCLQYLFTYKALSSFFPISFIKFIIYGPDVYYHGLGCFQLCLSSMFNVANYQIQCAFNYLIAKYYRSSFMVANFKVTKRISASNKHKGISCIYTLWFCLVLCICVKGRWSISRN